MKTFMTTFVLTALIATASFAEDFENTTFGLNTVSGPLDFSLDFDETEVTELEFGYTAFAYSVTPTTDANVRFAFGTELDETLYTRVEYNVTTELTHELAAYGTVSVQGTSDTDLDNTLWVTDPSIGVNYYFADTVAVYGEVGNTWDMSNDMTDLGGYVEVGMPIDVSTSLTITPSVATMFNTNNDATDLRLEVTYRF